MPPMILHLIGVWRLKLPHKIKLLLWQILHDCIHTQELRHRWNIASSALCQRCNNGPETTLHAIRDCRFSQRLWRYIVPHRNQTVFFSSTIKDWVKSNTSTNTSSDWIGSFGAGLWTIWCVRNKKVIGTGRPTFSTMKSDYHYLKENILAAFNSIKIRPPPRAMIGWSPPHSGCFKLNVDGCCKGNPGHAGAGGVFRDYKGTWIRVSSRYIGPSTNNAAEFWALRDGLSIAVRCGFSPLYVETDSQIIIKLLQSQVNNDIPLRLSSLTANSSFHNLISALSFTFT